MSPPTDNELIAQTLGGDVEAFGVLVERYQGPLYNAAYRITGNRDDALEATQNAFLKTYGKLRSYDPGHRFFSWIFRIVVNESLDIAGRRRRFDGEDAEGAHLLAVGDPESEVATAQAGALVRQALRRMAPDHRAVLVLRHFHDLSYGEIAAIVGVPEKTVKSRLFTARRELRELLQAVRSRGAG
jgi:RNA polymerase sigma-70 factor (ECF subfamily)